MSALIEHNLTTLGADDERRLTTEQTPYTRATELVKDSPAPINPVPETKRIRQTQSFKQELSNNMKTAKSMKLNQKVLSFDN